MATEARRSYILLVRHGETAANAAGQLQGGSLDPPLNQRGREQAIALSRALADLDVPVDLVASSGLARARETASVLASALPGELQVMQVPGLKEMQYGRLEGKQVREVAGELRTVARAWRDGRMDVAPGGGESPAQLLDRALPALVGLVRAHKPRHAVVVAHSWVNKALVAHARGDGLARMQAVPQDNCALNVLSYDHETGELCAEAVNARLSVDNGAAPARL